MTRGSIGFQGIYRSSLTSALRLFRSPLHPSFADGKLGLGGVIMDYVELESERLLFRKYKMEDYPVTQEQLADNLSVSRQAILSIFYRWH